MDKLIIEDTTFSHAYSSSWYNKTEKFEWDRNTNQQFDKIVITNLPSVDRYSDKKVYGWIIEPPDVWQTNYDYARNNFKKFEKIFTYDKSLLDLDNKFEILPFGGCWIDEEDRKIHKKNKTVSTICSSKKMTPGHRFRHETVSKLNNVDLFGSAYKPIDKKIEALKDYMFCIVMENQKMDYFFTEKIIDCFVTGTIPIYWGCPSIGDFFDLGGIYTFDTFEDLSKILSEIDEKSYLEKIDNIKNNFELSKKYVIADNLIYEKIN